MVATQRLMKCPVLRLTPGGAEQETIKDAPVYSALWTMTIYLRMTPFFFSSLWQILTFNFNFNNLVIFFSILDITELIYYALTIFVSLVTNLMQY